MLYLLVAGLDVGVQVERFFCGGADGIGLGQWGEQREHSYF